MDRTQRLSRALRRFASGLLWLCVLLLVFSPGLVLLDGFVLDSANHLLRLLDVDGFRFNSGHVGGMLRTFIWGLTAASLVTAVLSLGALIRLLHQFEWGTAFSHESVRLVRFLGWIQVAGAPIGLLMLWGLATVTKALTTQVVHPWKFAVNSSLEELFFGGITLLVAHVLDEGFRLKSEQDLVI